LCRPLSAARSAQERNRDVNDPGPGARRRSARAHGVVHVSVPRAQFSVRYKGGCTSNAPNVARQRGCAFRVVVNSRNRALKMATHPDCGGAAAGHRRWLRAGRVRPYNRARGGDAAAVRTARSLTRRLWMTGRACVAQPVSVRSCHARDGHRAKESRPVQALVRAGASAPPKPRQDDDRSGGSCDRRDEATSAGTPTRQAVTSDTFSTLHSGSSAPTLRLGILRERWRASRRPSRTLGASRP
jgi:hypothetical protein